VPDPVAPAGVAATATAAAAATAGDASENDDPAIGVPTFPICGHGQAGPIPFEFVSAPQEGVGTGGVSAATKPAMSEFPSIIGCTSRFMRAFCASIMACVIGVSLFRCAHGD
jgi:hypothetical protein